MSTARSIGRGVYSTRVARTALLLLLAATAAAGCKKRGNQLADDPDERGKLTRIATRLEEAYANAPLPGITEPASLAERLDKWDDFRNCTVRTYVARKRDADRHAREGLERPSRHNSIGDETVEECAVQMAVINKDPSVCERLAVDYVGPNGEMPLSAVRCWDTRARVLGIPDECPVVWMPADVPARNPECLAMARRDQSLCPFADSPGRCRALLTGDSASCGAMDSAPDCPLALEYWRGLIPAGFGPPLISPDDLKEKLQATFDLKWKDDAHPRIRIQGPKSACGISWPAGRAKPAWTEDTTKFWGGSIPPEAAQITWSTGEPSLKLAFVPGGVTSGVRALKPPGPSAPATMAVVWTDPQQARRCLPGAHTTGEIRFDAGDGRPGSFVTGKLEARNLDCTDQTELNVDATFRLLILDVR
jgi:hypothetical protein